jgi:hypothetical protein
VTSSRAAAEVVIRRWDSFGLRRADCWPAVNGPHFVALVRAGATLRKGVLVENPTEDQVAAQSREKPIHNS